VTADEGAPAPEELPRRTAPRRNPHLGIVCPPWCITDHCERFMVVCVGRSHDARLAWTSPIRNDEGFAVAISSVVGDGSSAHLDLSREDAEQLAILAGRAGSGALSAAIRQSLADITAALTARRTLAERMLRLRGAEEGAL
jgi:hypothetical protein